MHGQISMKLVVIINHLVHVTLMTFSRLWVQGQRQAAMGHKNLVNSIVPEQMMGVELKFISRIFLTAKQQGYQLGFEGHWFKGQGHQNFRRIRIACRSN